MKVRFHAPIKKRGINPYVLVGAHLVARIKPDWRRAMPVLVQVNGKPEAPARINMMPAGDGSFYLYLDGTLRKASGTKVGDHVRIALAFDPDYRGGPTDPLPHWFSDALNGNRAANKGWSALSPSRQKEIARYLVRLKSAEARQRNLEKALEVLGGAKGRFMARSWNED